MKIARVIKLIAYILLLAASLELSANLLRILYGQNPPRDYGIYTTYTLWAIFPPIALILCILSLLLENIDIEIRTKNPIEIRTKKVEPKESHQ